MALEYAIDLRVVDASTTDPAKPMDLAALVLGWLDLDEHVSEGIRPNPQRGGSVTFSTIGDTPAFEGWRAVLQHPDSADASVLWQTVVTITTTDGTRMGVRLHRRRSGAIIPFRGQARAPRFVTDLLNDSRFFCSDATYDIENKVHVVREGDAAGFARFLLHPEREMPVVGFTPRDNEVIDGDELLKRTRGLAHVAFVPADGSWALNDHLPPRLNVYGGAVRIWWPGLSSASDYKTHPLWQRDQSARRIYGNITRRIIDAAAARPAIDMRFEELERNARRQSRQRFADEVQALQQELSARADAPEPVLDDELTAKLREQFDGLYDEYSQVQSDLETSEELLEQYEDEIGQLKRDLYAARTERDRYLDAIKSGRADEQIDDASADFLSQLDARLAEMQLRRGDLHPFRLHERLLPSLEELGYSKYLTKTVQACAHVIADTTTSRATVEVHPLRKGDGPTAAQLTRPSDGAVAYRAYIESHTPSARRLHYWRLPDSSFEFACVCVHDVFSIPG